MEALKLVVSTQMGDLQVGEDGLVRVNVPEEKRPQWM